MASDQELFHELMYYTLAHPSPAFTHQHVVDAYAAQKADIATRPMTVVFALIGCTCIWKRTSPDDRCRRCICAWPGIAGNGLACRCPQIAVQLSFPTLLVPLPARNGMPGSGSGAHRCGKLGKTPAIRLRNWPGTSWASAERSFGWKFSPKQEVPISTQNSSPQRHRGTEKGEFLILDC